ncbi:ROK family transcriptional regulator [Mucilaginibacter koreensis]
MPVKQFVSLTDPATAKAIQYLYYRKTLTSSEISNQINKSIPHTIKLLADLIASGVVIEKGYAISSGGRKPLQYSLAANLFYTVSVAIDRFNIELALLDNYNEFTKQVVSYDIDLNSFSVDNLIGIINQFINDSGIPRSEILGIGITMPGFVDVKKGINYSFLPVEGTSLVKHMQRGIDLPLFIENDSTAIALAEQKFGVATSQDDAMIVNLSWGIGLGMIVNGEIFRGHTGLAGEFSHLPLIKNGKLCACGKHGCLETEASLQAIIIKAYDELRQGQNSSLANYKKIDTHSLINEATKGDMLAVRLISEAAYHVGQCLAILIHIMNPGLIALSGKGSRMGRLWLAPIQQAINEHCIPRLSAETQLVVSDLADHAQLIGGAVLVIEHIGKSLREKIEELEQV